MKIEEGWRVYSIFLKKVLDKMSVLPLYCAISKIWMNSL